MADRQDRLNEEAARARASADDHAERTRIGEEPEDREEGARLRERAQAAHDAAMGNDW